jgi:hypothetical protein
MPRNPHPPIDWASMLDSDPYRENQKLANLAESPFPVQWKRSWQPNRTSAYEIVAESLKNR